MTQTIEDRRITSTLAALKRSGKRHWARRYPANSVLHGYLSPTAMEWLEMAGNRVIETPGGYVINPSGQQRVGVV